MDYRRSRVGAEKSVRKLLQLNLVTLAKEMAGKRERNKRSEAEPT